MAINGYNGHKVTENENQSMQKMCKRELLENAKNVKGNKIKNQHILKK